jgi:cytoskeletal protein CcmA (bactofilin family)
MRDKTTQRIRTRGDVIVEKKGALLGTSITCGNLTVIGQVAGSIYASGDVIFRSTGRVLGEVRCRRLLVERRANIRFLAAVHVERLEVQGVADGHFYVLTKTLLGKKGLLDGTLETKTMQMEPGSQMHAATKINPKPSFHLHSPTTKELDAQEKEMAAKIAAEPILLEKIPEVSLEEKPESAPTENSTPAAPKTLADRIALLLADEPATQAEAENTEDDRPD